MNLSRTSWTIFLGLALSLNGCAGAEIPDAKPTTGRNPTVADVPDADETVRGDTDPPIVTLPLGSMLHEHRMDNSDELPGNVVIPTTNLNAVPITAALQAVLEGTDVSMSWDTADLSSRLVTVMNLSGPLPQVVDKICAAAKVFCSYRNGSLEVAEKQTFVVALPPIPRALVSSGSAAGSTGTTTTTTTSTTPGTNSMVDAINELLGGKVQVDDQGGNIIYTTDFEGENRVRQYLEQLRNGRPLVVLQLYIWEVTLNKENSEGVNWTSFNPGSFGLGDFSRLSLSDSSNFLGAASLAGLASGSAGIGAVMTGHINASALFSFLSTQGRVQTISNPQVTFVSGSSAEFKVGGQQTYIAQIGTATSNVSGTVANNTGTNTVSTGTINTGLTVDTGGVYENGVVFANFDLDILNLVSLNPTSTIASVSNDSTDPAQSQIIDLPVTTDEKVNTVIRVRPGDNLVMAGMVTSADTANRQGVPIPTDGRIPTYGDETMQNHELVIVVKPSIVMFSDKPEKLAKAQSAKSGYVPSALVIDKDGAKPAIQPAVRVSMPQAATTGTTTTATAAPAPLAPSVEDGAPVNGNFMQRGFSHAFDTLLHGPSTTNGGASQ